MSTSTDAHIISVWFTAEHLFCTIRLKPVHHGMIHFHVQILNSVVLAPHPEVQSYYSSNS